MADNADAPRDAAATPDKAPRRGAGLHVLLADDNKVNQNIIGRMLERLGCRVETADNGADAVAAVRRGAYDVVFMDVQMPGLDGIGATAAIRAMPSLARRQVWIVALTADAFAADARRCRAAGMNDFVAKPVRLADLDGCLARIPPAVRARSGT